MGVIHKLKKEVIDFIVVKKKENVALSCRQLAFLTMEKYQTRISKSSINTVLKQAQLSSSVGRRRGLNFQEKIKKFQIPGEKKKELFENISKLETEHKDNFPLISIAETPLLGQSVDKISKEAPLDIQPLNGCSTSRAEEMIKATEGSNSQKNVPACDSRINLLMGNAVQKFYFDFFPQEEKGSVFEGAGMIFLKAAEWEISTKSFLGTLLRKYADNSLSADFDALCETILFRELCGVSKKQDGDILSPQAMDEFNCLSQKTEYGLNGADFTKDIEFSQQLVMEYVTERRQAFLEISKFKLNLEDKTALIIDGQMKSVWKDNIDRDKYCPIEKAMTGLSKELITNNSACVFTFQYRGEESLQEIRQLIDCFEEVEGKRIASVEVYDDNNNSIASFSMIPAKKRHFIIGLDLSQKKLGEWAKLIGLKENTEVDLGIASQGLEMGSQDSQALTQEREKCFSFVEKKMFIVGEDARKGISVKILSLWQDQTKEPVLAILTNLEKGKAKDVLRAYFEKFPWEQPFEKSVQDVTPINRGVAGSIGLEDSNVFDPWHEEEEFNNIRNFKDIFQSFSGELHKYCLKHYFYKEKKEAFSYFQEKYYDLKGSLQTDSTHLYVTLKTPPNWPYLHDLFEAAKRINERHIFDWNGRKLLIYVVLQ